MNKILLAVILFVSLVKSEEINIWNRISDQYSSNKKKEVISSEPSQSNSIPSREYTSIKKKQDPSIKPSQSSSIASNTPQCTYFKVERVRQLNIRDKAGTPSNIVGKANNGDSVCVYDFIGKWGRTDRGWLSVKYLSKDYEKSNFLLADIDHDGKKERLQWEYLEVENTPEFLLQLKLLDDDGSLLWEGPQKVEDDKMNFTSMGYFTPEILNDIDGDGNIELVIGSSPYESTSPGYSTYMWDGEKFIKTTKSKFYRDLVWIDAPHGKTLKWTKIDYKDYSKKKKIWWTHSLQQMNNNNELHLVNIEGIQYTGDSFSFAKGILSTKAKIRFTPTGAVIEELIK